MTNKGKVTIELLDAIQDAFNRHDVDGILSYFADDCEWLMARGPDPSHSVRFGSFEADLREHRLARSGRDVPIQEQPFRLLALLLERPGELITREEMRGAI